MKFLFTLFFLAILIKISYSQDLSYWTYIGQNSNDHEIYYGNDYSYDNGSLYVWVYEKCNNDCGVIYGNSVYAKSMYLRISSNTYSIGIGHSYLSNGQETTNYYDWDSNPYGVEKGSIVYKIKQKLK